MLSPRVFTATSGLCFDNSDCRSLPSSACLLLDKLEGSCTCIDSYSSSEDERECLPGKAIVILSPFKNLYTNTWQILVSDKIIYV
jgi:hypothetical protein